MRLRRRSAGVPAGRSLSRSRTADRGEQKSALTSRDPSDAPSPRSPYGLAAARAARTLPGSSTRSSASSDPSVRRGFAAPGSDGRAASHVCAVGSEQRAHPWMHCGDPARDTRRGWLGTLMARGYRGIAKGHYQGASRALRLTVREPERAIVGVDPCMSPSPARAFRSSTKPFDHV
jgi:hypothetical protein